MAENEEEKVLSLRDQVISILSILQTSMGPAKLGINREQIPLKLIELQICSTIALVDELKRIADLLEKGFGENSSSLDIKEFSERVETLKQGK